MALLRNQQISLDKWEDLLINSPYGSVFQEYSFYKLCNCVPGMSAEAFAIEEDNTLKALCIVTLQKEKGLKGYFSKRAIIYGGPVLEGKHCENSLEYLLSSIKKELDKRSIYIEIRNLNNYSDFNETFIRNGWHYIPYQNIIVDCSNKEKLIQRLSNNRKRQIKKAVNSGVTIKEADSIHEITEFYSILRRLYKEKIKKPIFNKEFFIEIFNKNFGKYFIVIYMDRIIGGILCPIFEKKCIYEFYVCGLDDEYNEQCPSTMATWAAMEYANSNHIPVFDFMGAGLKDKDYGVREFKSRFGGELVENGRFIIVNSPVLYKTGSFTLRLMQKLKK
jgi:serine/alanine adding enzyme